MNKPAIEWKDEAQILSHYSPDSHYLPVLVFLLSSCLYIHLCLTSDMARHDMISTDNTVLSENYHLQITRALLNRHHDKLLPQRALVLSHREFVHLKGRKS